MQENEVPRERATVWITKYALTKGVLKVNAEITDNGGAFWDRFGSAWGEGRQWHRTEVAATARAEEMRKAKIVSLEKQIAKLRKLAFKP